MSDIVENISRIALIVGSGRPNQAELKQRENSLKKALPKLDSLSLLFTFRNSVVELVLSLQLIERSAKTRSFQSQSAPQLWHALVSGLIPQTSSPIVRRHAVSLAATLCLKHLKPDNLMEFLVVTKLSDPICMNLLEDIPSASSDDRMMLAGWADQVWPAIVNTGRVDLMEQWVEFVSVQTLLGSNFLQSIDITSLDEFEDVLLICCRKPGLEFHMSEMCMHLITNGLIEQGTKLFGGLTSGVNEYTLQVVAKIQAVLSSDVGQDLPRKIQIVENTLEFFTGKVVPLDSNLYEFLLILSLVPYGIENKYKIVTESDQEDELSNAGLRNRFLEIRQEIRHVLRTSSLASSHVSQQIEDLTRKALLFPDWRMTEAVLHAFSAQQKRFAVNGGELIGQMFDTPDPSSNLHRAPANAIVICGTTFFQSIPNERIDSALSFLSSCLTSIDTLDPTGWLPFRAKQDNSCVVLLQNIAQSKHPIPFEAISTHLLVHMEAIKQRLFYRDPFRQSRDIFVRSVAQLVCKSSTNPSEILQAVVTKTCDDCRDISIFVSQIGQFKQSVFPLIEPKLETFLRGTADGIQSLVATYSDTLTLQQILACIDLTGKPERWIEVAPQIAATHGEMFVLQFARAVEHLPLRSFQPDWFVKCLGIVEMTEKTIEYLISWFDRIVRSPFRGDSFEACITYLVSVLIVAASLNLPSSGHLCSMFILRMIQEVSSIHSESAVKALASLGRHIGWDAMKPLIKGAVPKLETESKLLGDALCNGEYGKARRIMKKMIIS